MQEPIREDIRTFVELQPDPEKRMALHYAFVFRYLPELLSRNPSAFFCEKPEAWIRKIQVRFSVFELMAHAGSHPTLGYWLVDDPVLRVVSDLRSRSCEVAGRPAVSIEMPVPEMAPLAFFVLLVLDTPAGPFGDAVARVNAEVSHSGPPKPEDHPLGEFQACEGLVFTLERTSEFEVTGQAVLCSIRADGTRSNFGIPMRPKSDEFVSAVAAILNNQLIPKKGQPGESVTQVSSNGSNPAATDGPDCLGSELSRDAATTTKDFEAKTAALDTSDPAGQTSYKNMQPKQLANILIKILGLSVFVHSIPSTITALQSAIQMSRISGLTNDYWYYLIP